LNTKASPPLVICKKDREKYLEKIHGVESTELEEGSESKVVGSSKTGGGIAIPGACTLTVQSANTQAILWILVETLSTLEAIFSALEGLAGAAAPEASAFSLLADTKVLRESNKVDMLGSLFAVFIGGGGGVFEGIVLGVGRSETKKLLAQATDPMVDEEILTF